MLVVVGAALGRGIDSRWLIAMGLIVMAVGNYWMAVLNLSVSPMLLIWPRIVLICGTSMIFAPISVAAFKFTPMHLRAAAVGLFALLRNEGGSVGTSLAQTIVERRQQFHNSRISDFLDPFNPAVQTFSNRPAVQQTGDAAAAEQLTLAATGHVIGLFRHLLAFRGACGRANPSHLSDEALGRRKRRPYRRRVDTTEQPGSSWLPRHDTCWVRSHISTFSSVA